ncbi:DUF4157 domain-containing protein [Dankookia rubra]|uniref:DUF4157 domain-containing protein n=1 Tax=Dankookia rubra TaxID=1442381 RepID=A0A4R5QGT6_9PROT|nr:DUF4157 domain-containing protein [Dankookia rubra]TDH62143.1 DUF4157 domain-containing protein [Dankookia rubra]
MNHTRLDRPRLPGVVRPPLPAGLREAASHGGEALPPRVQAEMTARFGYDFSGVRVHADDRSAVSTAAVGARAYAYGADLVFARGQYAPDRPEGVRVLAHELAHVVQQSRGGSSSIHGGLEREAEAAAEAVARGTPHVAVAGASGPVLAAMPAAAAPKIGTNFEGATTIVVELPGGRGTPGRADHEKVFRSLLPPNVVEDTARWHAAHAVGQGVGIEVREGILLAPSGVNLSIQGALERQISRIRADLPEGWTLFLQIETGAHPEVGTRPGNVFLKFINYELVVMNPGGSRRRALSASVMVTDDLQRPAVHVSVESSLGNEASRHYPDAFNAQKQRWTPADKQRPMQRPTEGYSYTATAGTLRRGKSNPEVSRRPALPTAGTSVQADEAVGPASAVSTPATAPARPGPIPATPPPQPVLPAPVPPGPTSRSAQAAQKPPTSPPPLRATGPQFAGPSNVADEAYQKAEAKGAGAVLALQVVGSVLTDLGNATQQRDAESAFYAKLPEITRMLQANPGMGVMVEYVFRRPDPMPESVIQPGDQFQFITFDVAASVRDVKPGIYAVQQGMELRIRRRWLPPLRPASGEAATAGNRTVLAVAKPGDLDALIGQLRHRGMTATDVALAFMAARRDFGGVHIDVGDLSLELPQPLYDQVLLRLQQAAAAALGHSLDTLEAQLRNIRSEYIRLFGEGWLAKRWHDRDFDLPAPTLIDHAASYARSSREALGKLDLNFSRSQLRTAREFVNQVESVLYRYLNGRPPPWEDT